MGYLFYPAADKQQDEIWQYTEKNWGEEQADNYIRGLHASIKKVVDNPLLLRYLKYKKLADISYIHYQHHFIFLRILSNGDLAVISILHEKMNLPEKLHKEVKQAEELVEM